MQSQNHTAEFRRQLGAELLALRNSKGIKITTITKATGLRFDTIVAIEQGNKVYEIDSLAVYKTFLDKQ